MLCQKLCETDQCMHRYSAVSFVFTRLFEFELVLMDFFFLGWAYGLHTSSELVHLPGQSKSSAYADTVWHFLAESSLTFGHRYITFHI